MIRNGRTILFRLVLVLLALTTGVAHAARPTVLFDQGHGERFTIGGTGPLQLSGLAAVLAGQGFQVTAATAPLTAESLANVDILVLSGPFRPLSTAELDAIDRFVTGGGGLAVMLHIGTPLAGVLDRLGIDFSTRPIREQEEIIDGDPLNFRVTRLAPHPLTDGLEHFSLFGAWALSPPAGQVAVARTSPGAWVDLNGDNVLSPGDAVQSFCVAVAGTRGRGRFAVFGDDALFQNRFLDADNRRLALNLAAWLAPPAR